MHALDALWHLLNLFVPAIGTAALAAGGAKLLWRRELAGVAWRVLALWGSAAGAVATVAGLAYFGRDGRIATYVALVVATALTLWWRGFLRRR